MICMCRNRHEQTRRSSTRLGRHGVGRGCVRPLRRAHLGLGSLRSASPHPLRLDVLYSPDTLEQSMNIKAAQFNHRGLNDLASSKAYE